MLKFLLSWLIRSIGNAQQRLADNKNGICDNGDHFQDIWNDVLRPNFFPEFPLLQFETWKRIYNLVRWGKRFSDRQVYTFHGFWPQEGFSLELRKEHGIKAARKAGYKIVSLKVEQRLVNPWDGAASEVVVIEFRCKGARGTFELSHEGMLIADTFFNSKKSRATLSRKAFQVSRCYHEGITEVGERDTPDRYVIPAKLEPTLARMRRFVQLHTNMTNERLKGTLRWVILVKGAPGTGKTWLFDMLPTTVCNGRLDDTDYIESNLNKYIHERKLKNDDDDDDNKAKPSPVTTKRGDDCQCYSEYGMVPYQVLDEVDRYVSSYTKNGVDQKQADNVYMFKHLLDTSSGIIVLITNYPELLDESIKRAGRINEVIDFDKHFYTLEEKQKILASYMKDYGIDTKDIKTGLQTIEERGQPIELNEMTIAELENLCREAMLNKLDELVIDIEKEEL